MLILGLTNLVAQNSTDVFNQQPDSFSFSNDTTYVSDSLRADSMFTYNRYGRKTFGLIDSLTNDSILRVIIKPYQFITNNFVTKTNFRRS